MPAGFPALIKVLVQTDVNSAGRQLNNKGPTSTVTKTKFL